MPHQHQHQDNQSEYIAKVIPTKEGNVQEKKKEKRKQRRNKRNKNCIFSSFLRLNFFRSLDVKDNIIKLNYCIIMKEKER